MIFFFFKSGTSIKAGAGCFLSSPADSAETPGPLGGFASPCLGSLMLQMWQVCSSTSYRNTGWKYISFAVRQYPAWRKRNLKFTFLYLIRTRYTCSRISPTSTPTFLSSSEAGGSGVTPALEMSIWPMRRIWGHPRPDATDTSEGLLSNPRVLLMLIHV